MGLGTSAERAGVSKFKQRVTAKSLNLEVKADARDLNVWQIINSISWSCSPEQS